MAQQQQAGAYGWYRYLEVVTLVVALFAAAMVLTPLVSDVLFAWMIFGEPGVPAGFSDAAADYIRFSHGVLGAVMVGWLLLVRWLVRAPLAHGDPGAWHALTLSLVGWFVVDSTYSLLTGYWQNAVLNSVVLAAYLPGLVATRPRPARAGSLAAPS